MRVLIAIAGACTLAACASSGGEQTGGYANYDALQRAQKDCAAKGGTLKLKPEGNAERIDAYACERK